MNEGPSTVPAWYNSIGDDASANTGISSTNNEIDSLAEDAVNVAVKHIQDKLGIKAGDFAGIFFSYDDYVLKVFKEYIRGEMFDQEMMKNEWTHSKPV